MKTLTVKHGREKQLQKKNPWLHAGSIAKHDNSTADGDVVRVVDAKGVFIAYALYEANKKLPTRLLSWNEDDVIDDAWWCARINDALARRAALTTLSGEDAVRLVFGEADGVPGLIVDRYAEFIVIQVNTEGVARVKDVVVRALVDAFAPKGIYERSDTKHRERCAAEGAKGVLYGEAPPVPLVVRDGNVRMCVTLTEGQKTGYYIDQRENRRRVARYAKGKRVLDVFSYTGGFALHAMDAGAQSVTLMDNSRDALAQARAHFTENGYTLSEDACVVCRAFDGLRAERERGKTYDLIVLDPPKFAPTKASVAKALVAYKDIAFNAMRVLQRDGILATFSCSGAVTCDEFARAVAWAALDAKRNVRVLETLSQPADHPILLSFPESRYLKGLICHVE